MPAVQDRIGTDMLTVESPSIDQAVESLKKILPDIQGKVLDEQNRQIGGTVLTVVIPPQAYGDLTTELVHHGSVAVGPRLTIVRRRTMPARCSYIYTFSGANEPRSSFDHTCLQITDYIRSQMRVSPAATRDSRLPL